MVKKPKIKTLITKINKTKRSTPMSKNGYIVVHFVGAVSSAKNNAMFFYDKDRQASAHYFVDDDEIWQSVRTKKYAAWHCGGSRISTKGGTYFGKCKNDNSIGIEMCCKKDSKGNLYITDKTIERTAKLVKWIMQSYEIPASHVIRHFDVTGKSCPGGYTTAAKWKTLKAKLTE